MTQYLSNKLKIVSFVSIILVLYIHSDFHDYPHEILGMKWNHYLQDFISKMIGRCAVPMFFMISGYLFFYQKDSTMADIYSKMRKRIRTLLVPFIIAALLFPIFFFFASFVPGVANYMNTDVLGLLKGTSLLSAFKVLFLDSGTGQPLAFHLWFLRDLIGIVAFAPLLFLGRKYLPMGILSASFFVLTYVFPQVGLLISFFWFVFGSECFLYVSRVKTTIIPLLFILLCVVEIAFPNIVIWDYLKLPIILLGIASIWILYDVVFKSVFLMSNHKRLAIACQFTFFIYLYHEPFLNIVRKIIAGLMGKTSFAFAVSYLLSPWLFMMLWIGVGIAIKRCLPKVYGVLMGGR